MRVPISARADLLRTGEGDNVGMRVLHQILADRAPGPWQELDHTGRQPCLLEQRHKARGDDRCLRRGFENHRIAGDEGG
jgi:hypothetical protein